MDETITFEKLFEILAGEYGPYIGTVTENDENGKRRSYLVIRRNPAEPTTWTCSVADDDTVRVNGHLVPWSELTYDDIVTIRAYVFEWLIRAGVESEAIYKFTPIDEHIDPKELPYVPGMASIAFDQMRSMPDYVIKNRSYLSKFFTESEIMQATRFLEKMCRVNPNPLKT